MHFLCREPRAESFWTWWNTGRRTWRQIGEQGMKRTVIALAAAFLAIAAHAQTAQQNLMKSCNTEAAGKKGDDRKAFMKSCLSNGSKRQQERMKVCAAENKGKKGAEYKQAQKDCLSKG